MDVEITGIGLHPFGRFDGVSVTDMGVAAVQAALRAEGVDGWLLYDFQGSNPVAARMAAVGLVTVSLRRSIMAPKKSLIRRLTETHLKRHEQSSRPCV